MLHGELVTLRPMERADIPRLWEFAQDLEVGLATGTDGRPTPLAVVEQIYEQRYSHVLEGAINFGVEAHGLLIGGIEFRNVNWLNRTAEIILFIGDPAYRRHGAGTDALRVAANYAFKLLGFNRLTYTVPEDNTGAVSAYTRVGFKQEGILREAHYRDGRYLNLLVLGLIRAEWQDSSPLTQLTAPAR